MDQIKLPNSKNVIPNDMFNICLIDNLSMSDICKKYTCADINKKSGVYKLNKFAYHLLFVHGISLKEYCKQYLKVEWPLCPAKKVEVGFRITGEGILLRQFSQGGVNKETCPAFARGCEKLSRERMGENNPMYGKETWNKGLGLEDERIRRIAESRTGLKMSEESKEKMRQRRRESPLKARHTTPHSPETVEKLRVNTARLWAEGVFSKTTSIHLKMREFLSSLNLVEKPVEEFQDKYYSIDFALPERKIAIECDGDYYHVNPAFFPDGPKDAIQRRNFGRDKAKNTFLTNRGWTILRFWECEINSGIFKEKLICGLKELNLLKD